MSKVSFSYEREEYPECQSASSRRSVVETVDIGTAYDILRQLEIGIKQAEKQQNEANLKEIEALESRLALLKGQSS